MRRAGCPVQDATPAGFCMRISLSPTGIRLHVVFALGVGLLLAHPWPARAQRTWGTFFGKVWEKDGTGIAGAKVTIVNEEDDNKRAVLTDDTGYYSRPYLPAGKYTLIAHKDGYVDRIVKSFPVQFNQKN